MATHWPDHPVSCTIEGGVACREPVVRPCAGGAGRSGAWPALPAVSLILICDGRKVCSLRRWQLWTEHDILVSEGGAWGTHNSAWQ